MKQMDEFSEELLQAYVDGELDHEESERLLSVMMENPTLKNRVCRLQHLKGLVKNAFPLDPYGGEDQSEIPVNKPWQRWFSTAAGVVFGALSMVLVYSVSGGGSALSGDIAGNEARDTVEQGAGALPVVVDTTVATARKVLLHLDSSDEQHFDETLDYAEELLKQYGERGVKVEVLANAGGVDLFREETSPYKARLKSLSAHYENLEFIACANALANLERRGEAVHLLPAVHDDVTALEHVVKRIQEGWAYIKI